MTAPQGVYPPEMAQGGNALKMSPAVISQDHIFVSGMTGSGPDGTMPQDPEAQIRAAFKKIGAVLEAAGADWRAVVDMTTYHVGLQGHFDLFNAVLEEHVSEPFPAWTAVEVTGLRRAGAVVEIKVVAHRAQDL